MYENYTYNLEEQSIDASGTNDKLLIKLLENKNIKIELFNQNNTKYLELNISPKLAKAISSLTSNAFMHNWCRDENLDNEWEIIKKQLQQLGFASKSRWNGFYEKQIDTQIRLKIHYSLSDKEFHLEKYDKSGWEFYDGNALILRTTRSSDLLDELNKQINLASAIDTV